MTEGGERHGGGIAKVITLRFIHLLNLGTRRPNYRRYSPNDVKKKQQICIICIGIHFFDLPLLYKSSRV